MAVDVGVYISHLLDGAFNYHVDLGEVIGGN